MAKLRLSEPEILLACQFSGSYSHYDEPYDQIKEGEVIVLWTEVQEDDSISRPEAYKLRLDAIKSGEHRLDEVTEDPPVRLFEATVLRTTDTMIKPSQKVFGAIFPGFASLVDSGPRSDYTNRRLAAALVYFEHRQSA